MASVVPPGCDIVSSRFGPDVRQAAAVASATLAAKPSRARGLVLVLAVFTRTLSVAREIAATDSVTLMLAVARRSQGWVVFVRPGAWVTRAFARAPERFAIAFRRRVGIGLDRQGPSATTIQLVSRMLNPHAL